MRMVASGSHLEDEARAAQSKPRVAISACLLGQSVRFDGGHKRHGFLCDGLGPHVAWDPVCPEVEAGLAIPREALRLVGPIDRPQLRGNRTGLDRTDQMTAYARQRVSCLAQAPLDGYVLKKDSPSCGLTRVKVYGADGSPPDRRGTGLFAQVLQERLPALPLTEEGRLQDPGLRECFLHQVFTHHRLRIARGDARDPRALVEAHARHKFLLMAHSPAGQKEAGRVIRDLRSAPLDTLWERYLAVAMRSLAEPASRGKHANVLLHILGFLKETLAPPDRNEILTLVEEFRTGLHALGVPLAMLAHHIRRCGLEGWIAEQVYFQPVPRALSPFVR